jgi:hypothetical protein
MAKQTFTTGQVLTAAQMTSLQETAMGGGDTTAKTTSYVLVAADAGTVVAMNAAGATTITVNTSLFAAGDTVTIQNRGAGVCTVTAGTATVVTAGSLALAQNEGGILYFTATGAAVFYDFVQSSGSTIPTSLEFTAGKNKIINGDFNINQRAFTSTTTTGTYGLDRWFLTCADGTVTYSVQAFTPGAAPVAGYEAANFARIVTTGQTATSANGRLRQQIENVRNFAGQTVTVSFWAKAASGTPKVAVEFVQNFGSGGSPSSSVTNYAGQVTLSTTWERKSVTFAIPSISGKTIGTTANTSMLEFVLYVSAGSDFNARTGSLGIQSNTFDIWGVQVEDGSVATAFQTATGTLQGELAACQRYYYRISGENNSIIATGLAASTTLSAQIMIHKSTMRVPPTSIDYSSLDLSDTVTGYAVTNLVLNTVNTNISNLTATVASGLTQYRPYNLDFSGASGYVGLSAEL